MKIAAAGDQILGQRERQEDCFTIVEDGNRLRAGSKLLVICDGMGGHAGGAIASKVAIEKFTEIFLNTNGGVKRRLKQALLAANDAIAAKISKEPSLSSMGTTLVAAYTSPTEIVYISVGDSLIYLFSNGVMTRLNEDHSMAPVLDDLAEAGRITPEEARADPQRNALRSALTGDEIDLIDLQEHAHDWASGDILFLTSDGVDIIGEAGLAVIAKDNQEKPVEKIVYDVLDGVKEKQNPHQDNTTVIAVTAARKKKFFFF